MNKLIFILAIVYSIVQAQVILGSSPETQVKFVNNNGNFQCFDGKKTIPFDRINDDYCDCEDGSDEPGTSACSYIEESKFYCKNVGFYPKFVHSSIVNDGSCDCCDGSDENDGKITCQNTCKQAGENIRKELTEKIVEFQAALIKKSEYVSQAAKTLEEKTKRLNEVKVEFEREDTILKELEAKKNQLEQVENAEKAIEKDEEMKKHQEEAKKFEDENKLLGEEKPKDADNPFVKFLEEEEKKKEGEKPKEEEKKEEEKPKEEVKEPETKQEEQKPPQVVNEGFFTNTVKKITQFYHKFLLFYHSYNFNRTEAEEARKKHAEQQSKVEPLKSELEMLQKDVGFSAGHSAFFVLKDKCFNVVDKQYTYEVCLFSNSHQKSKDGSSTHLGNWDSWDVEKKTMKYTNGQSCWNGPNRSAHVRIKCGLNEQLMNVDEPSMCYYTLDFETPAACNEEDLDQLKKELSMLNGE
eukprot:gene7960-12426_t